MEMESDARDFLRHLRGEAILHISDTETASYPHVIRMIKAVRPRLLIHTGDMADEFKVGRIPEHLPGYRQALEPFIREMVKYAREVWINCGNNDDRPWLEKMEGLTVFPMEGTQRAFGKLRFHLTHIAPGNLDENAYDFALYGHGYTADHHDPKDNAPGRLCYFNGVRCATLIDSQTGDYIHLNY